MKKQTIVLAVVTSFVLALTSGCASSEQPEKKEPAAVQPQKPAEQAPGQAPAPATQKPSEQPPATAQPKPTQPAAGKDTPITPEGKPTPANRNDYTNELILHPSIVIGKTTMDEMIAAYGQPVKTETIPTPYKVPAAGGEKAVEQIMASFNVNPLTGEKFNKPYPFYFTKNKKILAAAPIFFLRDGLIEKVRNNTITFEHVKKSYGEITRKSDHSLQLIDYDHHISLHVEKDANNKLSAVLVKYDLFFAGQPAALKDYEEMARLAKVINEAMAEEHTKKP